MIMSTACVLIRAIISLMIILNYGEIVTAIKAIYHTEYLIKIYVIIRNEP